VYFFIISPISFRAENNPDQRDVKLQIELEGMIDKKSKDTIQTQIEDIFLGLKSELQTMNNRILEMEKYKKSTQQRGVE
jgi:hypothetical protein